MAKDRIIRALGEDELLPPALVGRALDANDRVKYLLTLLQTARAWADGDRSVSDLRDERLASGVADASLDAVVAASVRRDADSYVIPGAEDLTRRAFEEVDTMLAPLRVEGDGSAKALGARVAALRGAVRPSEDIIAPEDVTRLAAGPRDGRDSLHLVVVDGHREFNRLQGRLATESIDGALAHDLAERDRPLVRAFARGVLRTEGLRFGHPGLETVATRSGDALVIQNEIGETEAHVLVVRVVGAEVTVTYTDVHLSRLLFFQRLFEGRGVRWDDTRSRSEAATREGLYHLAVGRVRSTSVAGLEEFLRFLGSRIVFLIDWNRARKRVRSLVGNRAAIELLTWAAEREYGHMAFLRAGGDELVYEALDFAAGRGTRARESLTDVLGKPAARTFLRSVLRVCSEGMGSGRPRSLIRDEVGAELIGYVRTARQELLALIQRHAELVEELGETARDALEQAALPRPSQDRQAIARLARECEGSADEVVNAVRAAASRAEDRGPFLELVEAADDVADSLEEATYYWTLLPQGRLPAAVRGAARRMTALVLEAARSFLQAVQVGREVQRGGPHEEMDAFLESVHRVVALERETDDVQRLVHAALVREVDAAAELFVLVEATRAKEEAADALMHAVGLLHRHVLGEVVRSEPRPSRAPSTVVTTPRPADVGQQSDDLHVIGERGGRVPDAATVGAKAHGLARMARAGLTVPEAVAVGTAVSRRRLGADEPPDVGPLLLAAVASLHARTGLRFGSSRRPLLVSVRSGAPVSMPGMLATVLNVGLCDASVGGLVALTGNPRLAWDSYRRLVEGFAAVVSGCPVELFEQATRDRVQAAGVSRPRQLDARTLAELTREHLGRYADLVGRPFPQDPLTQLREGIEAVLDSWRAPKAREYRRLHGVDESLGTAVILQRMVFGNARGAVGLEVHHELGEVCQILEGEFGDAQEFEFTVQDGRLFLLQTRTAKRTPWAALRIAVDQVREGLITPSQGRERLAAIDLDALRRVRVRNEDRSEAVASALPAGVGVATGPIALDANAAQRSADEGRPPVLVRPDTTTEDLAGMVRSAGVLTASGGRTSHAAVVARELAKPCLVGWSDLEVDLDRRSVTIGDREFAEGDEISLDAESGLVFAGRPHMEEERPTEELAIATSWEA